MFNVRKLTKTLVVMLLAVFLMSSMMMTANALPIGCPAGCGCSLLCTGNAGCNCACAKCSGGCTCGCATCESRGTSTTTPTSNEFGEEETTTTTAATTTGGAVTASASPSGIWYDLAAGGDKTINLTLPGDVNLSSISLTDSIAGGLAVYDGTNGHYTFNTGIKVIVLKPALFTKIGAGKVSTLTIRFSKTGSPGEYVTVSVTISVTGTAGGAGGISPMLAIIGPPSSDPIYYVKNSDSGSVTRSTGLTEIAKTYIDVKVSGATGLGNPYVLSNPGDYTHDSANGKITFTSAFFKKLNLSDSGDPHMIEIRYTSDGGSTWIDLASIPVHVLGIEAQKNTYKVGATGVNDVVWFKINIPYSAFSGLEFNGGGTLKNLEDYEYEVREGCTYIMIHNDWLKDNIKKSGPHKLFARFTDYPAIELVINPASTSSGTSGNGKYSSVPSTGDDSMAGWMVVCAFSLFGMMLTSSAGNTAARRAKEKLAYAFAGVNYRGFNNYGAPQRRQSHYETQRYGQRSRRDDDYYI